MFTIENRAASFLTNPEVRVTIRGARAITRQDAAHVELHEVLPHMDDPNASDWMRSQSNYRHLRAVRSHVDLTWDSQQDGTVNIILTPKALRPSTPWQSDDDELVLISLDPEADALEATWSLTAEGYGDRLTGSETIPVRQVVDVGQLLHQFGYAKRLT